jgi:hypothetical protein
MTLEVTHQSQEDSHSGSDGQRIVLGKLKHRENERPEEVHGDKPMFSSTLLRKTQGTRKVPMVRFPISHRTVASKDIPVGRTSTKIPSKEKPSTSSSVEGGGDVHTDLKTFEHEIDVCVNNMKSTLLVSLSCNIP